MIDIAGGDRRNGLALVSALTGGLLALVAVSFGWTMAGLSAWVLCALGAVWFHYTARHAEERVRSADSVRALMDPKRPPSCSEEKELAREVGELLDTVGTLGQSIRDVVRYLQEHATLVAWIIDNLEHAAEEVNGHLDEMRLNAVKVTERGGKVLEGSRTGMQFVSTIGQSTEALSRDVEALNRSVQNANAAVSQIQNALGNIEGGIGKLSTASDRSTQFVTQVAGTMSAIRERMRQSLNLFEEVAAYTRRGREVVNNVGRGMEEIRRSSESTMQRVDELSRKSKQIEQVLGIITEVADETNLLSLNAAILAAQAGERGAAFAVVADQIRSLAHRTQESIRHIEGIVREVQEGIREVDERMIASLDAVHSGEAHGHEAVEQLLRIEGAVTDSVEQARKIAGAAEEQSENAGQMVSIAGGVNKDLHAIVSHLQQSARDMDGIRELVQKVSVLSNSAHSAARTNHQSALDVSNLMTSFVGQMEEIDRLVEGERQDINALGEAMGPVGESALSTKESLETIHKIVGELVRHADNLQEEVERHMPLPAGAEEVEGESGAPPEGELVGA